MLVGMERNPPKLIRECASTYSNREDDADEEDGEASEWTARQMTCCLDH
jgi:hypothetical protein